MNARLTGVQVGWIKFQAYVFSPSPLRSPHCFCRLAMAINAMGTGYELRVIAGTVVSSANLMGATAPAFGAVIGSAFLEVIRNALLM